MFSDLKKKKKFTGIPQLIILIITADSTNFYNIHIHYYTQSGKIVINFLNITQVFFWYSM